MGREFPTGEEEFKLSLELSIGGCYAKSEARSLERETRSPSEGDDGSREIPRSDFSGENPEIDAAAENGIEFSDLQKRREMHAMKRREARMKMEFKKSRGMSGVGGGFVEDRAHLEFHGRAEERERRETEEIPEEPARKREKCSNASPLGENKVSYERQPQFVLPAVGNGFPCPWVVPLWGSNVVAGERDERNSGDHPPENVAAPSWFGRRSSSAVSHHRSTSLKGASVSGGSSSDTASHSSSFGTHQTDKAEHLELNNSSSLIGSTEKVTPSSSIQQQQQQQSNTSKSVQGSKIHAHSSPTGNTCAMTEKPSSSSPTSGAVNTPPKVSDGSGSGLQMPCVSTTGNGPNGRTIAGFLHKYTKSEVSIMCVCHGSFFSPAGFVEHAGGVDITHPLRHIIVVPSVVR